MAAQSSLYNEDRNLLRIREKERRNQEAHQDKEAFSEKIPLFGEPYKTEKGDELSSRIQNMLGDYEEMKEFLSSKSHPQRLDASENRLGKPRYPLFPEKGSSIPPHSFHTSVHHQPVNTPACGPLPDGNISHHPRMAQPRMEPMPSLHAKSYGPPDSQHLTQERLGQEGYGSSHHKKGDRRADGDHCALTTDSAPERELSPLLSLPSPVPPLSPVHSNQQTAPRMQGSGKVPSSSSSNKGYCLAKSPKDLAVKVHDKETPQDSTGAVASLGVAPPQPPSQTFPPPSLPSKSLAMQQKPTAYVRPMDGQDQAPSESPELKPLPEEYRQQTFEKSDLKVPAKAKLTKLKMPSQSVEQTYSNEVHCVEEILKEMTHSWPPPLTAIHTPSTAEPSKFPFPTKDSQHISSAVPNQKQYDTSSKTHSNSQQGTSMLKDDLQLSDSEEDSDSDQTSEKPAFAPAPPSAPPALPAAEASAHSSSAESESTSDSDSSSDSESESSSSDSEENEPREAPAPEPEPPTTNKWQLDNWLTKVSQPAVPTEAPGSTEPPARHPDTKGKGGDSITAGHERPESKELPPKGSNKAPRVPSEGPHLGKRSCQKSPAQQEPPQRQTVGSKQPKKPIKASAPGHTDAPADARACLQVESEPGLPPPASKDQPSKDKPKVKTKGRPRAADSREPKPAVPTPSDRKKHRSGPPKAPPKDAAAEDRSPEHFALVPLTQSQGPVRGGAGARTSGCRLAVVVQEDRRKDKPPVPSRDTKLLSPLRDAPPPQSLVVKITLDLLSRIPQPPGKGSRPKKPEDKQPPAGKKPDPEKRSSENASKLAKKRKGEAEKDHDSKKVRLEKEVKSQPSSSSSHKEPSKSKMSRPSSEPSKKEMLPPSLVSSSSSQKPAKPAQKRPRQEDPGGQDPPKSASSTKGSHRDPSASKHRKAEGKVFGSSTEHKGSSGDTANRFPVPSLPNGNSKPGKPHVKFDKQQADFHLKEAKRLKDKAELVTDKVGKAFKYLEAALSFIECGVALESESPASKSAYSIYSETVDLIKFILSLKSFSDATTPTQEKIFAVLCMRCQSILNMAMFRCKKDMAIKYSRTLNEHFFKTSSKVAQAPSPCIARSTGTPSPLSPIPSPASSIGSQSSAGSVGSGALPATISTPVTIQNMTSSYVSITSHVLTAFDLWEQAEVLTRKNKEFFAQLSTSVCALALNSSLMDLVHYTRQGFQRLKQVTKTP